MCRVVESSIKAFKGVAEKRLEFPVEVFPPGARAFVQTVAASRSCPVDFPAVAALVVAGVAVGDSRSLLVRGEDDDDDDDDDWFESANLFAGIVGRPGSKKSPAMQAVIEPLRAEQQRILNEFCPDEENSKPPGIRLTTDATAEGLAHALAHDSRGLLVFHDELISLVKQMDRYHKGDNRQMCLSFFSRTSIYIRRKSKPNEPISIERPFVSVLGGIQFDVLNDLIRSQQSDDGFQDRLLLACPPKQKFPRWSKVGLARGQRDNWSLLIQRLLALKHDGEGKRSVPRVVCFDAAAQARFIAFHDSIAEAFDAEILPSWIENFTSKLIAYCARFALILHMLRVVESDAEDSRGQRIGVADVEGAIDLFMYFLSHAIYIRQNTSKSSSSSAGEAVIQHLCTHGKTEVKAYELSKMKVSGKKSTAEMQKVLGDLVAKGFGFFREPKGREKSPVFVLLSAATLAERNHSNPN